MLKLASLEVLRRIPISSEILGPPKHFYRSTEDWLASKSKAATSSRIRELVPTFSGVRSQPITFGVNIPWQFEAFYGGSSLSDPSGWVAEIPGGRVFGYGAVITPDDCLLGDVSRELLPNNDQSKHSILSRRRLPTVKQIHGKAAVLATAGAFGYWHWFYDVLPRLLLVEQINESLASIDTFIVNQFTKPFQNETIERLGIPPEKVLECHSESHIRADLLIVPSLFVEIPSKWACCMLRDRFLSQSTRESGRQRLYISRSDAGCRRVLNEEALLEKLTPLGFKKVTLSGRSVMEQCQLFSSAEFIVAPHGAGLTNLLFCREGTRVLELFSPTYINPCYWVLANNLGLEYYCSFGDGPLPPPPPSGASRDDWFWSFVNADTTNGLDIHANIDNVVSVLHRAMQPIG